MNSFQWDAANKIANYPHRISSDVGFIIPKATGKGIQVETAAPTFPWRDLLGELFVRSTGAGRPSRAIYRDSLSASQFSAGDDEDFEYHIPHDYLQPSDIHLHVHWSHTGAFVTGGTLTFTYAMTYAKAHNQAPFPAEVSTTFVGTASATQYQQILTEVQVSATSPSANQIDSDNIEPDGVIILRLEMTTNNMTVSEGGVPDPFIHYVDIHYQSTGIGTKEKAPDFYA